MPQNIETFNNFKKSSLYAGSQTNKLIVYLDESYDQPKKRLILLCLLFSPLKKLHRLLTEIYKKKRCLDNDKNIIETQYNNYFSGDAFKLYKYFIDAIFISTSFYFVITAELDTTTTKLR